MKYFKYRFATKEDYTNILMKWWDAWKFPAPPVECLPDGIVVSDGEGDLYAGYVYITDGAIAWIEWVVSDKDASTDRRKGALKYLVDVLSGIAKDKGMKLIFTSTSLEGYRNSLKKCGFQDGDSNTYQLIKGL